MREYRNLFFFWFLFLERSIFRILLEFNILSIVVARLLQSHEMTDLFWKLCGCPLAASLLVLFVSSPFGVFSALLDFTLT